MPNSPKFKSNSNLQKWPGHTPDELCLGVILTIFANYWERVSKFIAMMEHQILIFLLVEANNQGLEYFVHYTTIKWGSYTEVV